ncbi:Hemoglobinase [Fasciolopsis buskii]|uniref:Hemoglobinase n=1 Tax=Fasciolopsis buskii TaxID=27845 RepID=A0A8E0VID6_9TREM|nr:Hemoglobinase [Fasciolopsis buski]
MKMFPLVLFCLCVILPTLSLAEETGKNWVVLVAGSNGWYNYRHQADIAHAYKILRANGIPQENIITMMYDDIAYNPRNPFPGKLFNDYAHEDVYTGIKIDYRGVFVTPQMFLRVLQGDENLKKAGKKVLDSEAEDNVFIFFSDHGAENLISFPNGVLYANQLVNAIKRLKNKNRFKRATIYLEACYSGSMFQDLLQDKTKTYATTAANAKESSWATFCKDSTLHTCLADDYSYKWMNDTVSFDIERRTLREQFLAVQKAVEDSHVCEWGDDEVGGLPVADFQAYKGSKVSANKTKFKFIPTADKVPSHQAHLAGIMRTIMITNNERERANAQKKLNRALQLKHLVEETSDDIVAEIKNKLVSSNKQHTIDEELECYQTVFDAFQIKCFTINQVPEVAHQSFRFGDLCRAGYDAEEMVHVINDVCV